MMTESIQELLSGEEISGAEVIQDLCGRLADELSNSCFLLATDAYQSYSARVTVEIQLQDIDSQTVKKTLVIGDHDPARPSQRIEVDVPPASSATVRERSRLAAPNLERTVNGDAPAAAPPKRYYTPRHPRRAVG